jgi:hypothetical protein
MPRNFFWAAVYKKEKSSQINSSELKPDTVEQPYYAKSSNFSGINQTLVLEGCKMDDNFNISQNLKGPLIRQTVPWLCKRNLWFSNPIKRFEGFIDGPAMLIWTRS